MRSVCETLNGSSASRYTLRGDDDDDENDEDHGDDEHVARYWKCVGVSLFSRLN